MHPFFANDARKTNPDRRAAQMCGVADERMAVELLGKQAFAKSNGLGLLHLVQTMRLPHRFWGFDDERRHFFVKLVGVGGKPAVLGLLEGKGEGVKLFPRPQPDEAALPGVDIGLVRVGIAGADAAVQAVAGDDQIRVVRAAMA